MDMFARFHRSRIGDRQVDTLIGVCKGLIADGKVDQREAEFLQAWLVQNRSVADNPVIQNLLQRVDAMLQDGVLDADESTELLGVLQALSGDASEVGELARTSGLPTDDPMPAVAFPGKSFLFTGTCAYGTRAQCRAAVEARGGINAKSVTKSLDYLVLGTYVTDSWMHETFGRKIEKAVDYRARGAALAIITEAHWADAAGL